MSEKIYRDHPYVANSDLKALYAQINGVEEPDNLVEIYKFGTLSHQLILESHKADYTHEDIALGLEMKETFFKDNFCKAFVEHPHFRAEHEFYIKDILGISGKCRMDGEIKSRKDILEFKSLSITTQSAFEEAIYHFSYDMGLAFYLDVSRYKRALIAAISKKRTDRLFKMIITREDEVYKSGLRKYTEMVEVGKELLN